MSEETILKAEVEEKGGRASWPALLLIGAGFFLLITNLLHISLMSYLWPGFIAGLGVLLLWPSYQSTAQRQSGFSFLAVPGAMLLAMGGLFFLMRLTNHFESMAYSWTLILAAGAGGYAYLKRFEEFQCCPREGPRGLLEQWSWPSWSWRCFRTVHFPKSRRLVAIASDWRWRISVSEE